MKIALVRDLTLPSRYPDVHIRCANPHCWAEVRIRGEFCRACRTVQEQMRQTLRSKCRHFVRPEGT